MYACCVTVPCVHGLLHMYRHREELEEILRNITMERKSVLNALVWCMEHADGAQEVSTTVGWYCEILGPSCTTQAFTS